MKVPSIAFAGILLLASTACGAVDDPSTRATPTEGVIPFKNTPIEPKVFEELEAQKIDAFRNIKITLEQMPIDLHIDEVAEYIVVLTNTSASPINLEPCPAYLSSFGEAGTAVFQVSFLNCTDAPSFIAPLQSLRFAMQIEVRGDVIPPGFKGELYWRLLSAPSDGNSNGSASGPMITVSGRPTSTVPSPSISQPAPDLARLLGTKGRLLGRGRFQLGTDLGHWSVFLEGSPEHPEIRQVAVLDSGTLVCEMSGSTSGSGSPPGIAIYTCGAPSALTFGVVPSDIATFEVVLGGAGGRRSTKAELAVSAEDLRVRGFSVVHSVEEHVLSYTGYRADGTVFRP